MALAWRFGASATVDAFRIAALVVLFGQQIFVIQILPSLIIPLFTEYRAQRNEREAWLIVWSLTNLLLVPTALISAFLFVRPDAVVQLLGPGLGGGRAEPRPFSLFAGLA
jgi:peptidoglycan biosynthesis protein MviN/MurJ (putative lipid II flippase)